MFFEEILILKTKQKNERTIVFHSKFIGKVFASSSVKRTYLMVKSSINRCPKKTMKREFCKGVGIMRKMGYNALLLPLSPSIFFHRQIRKLNANQPETRFTCNKSRVYGWDNIDKIVVKRCFIPVERVEARIASDKMYSPATSR